MTIFSDLDLKQRAEDILNAAHSEGEVRIHRENGETFLLRSIEKSDGPYRSGLDVEGVRTNVTLEDILKSIRESRERA